MLKTIYCSCFVWVGLVSTTLQSIWCRQLSLSAIVGGDQLLKLVEAQIGANVSSC